MHLQASLLAKLFGAIDAAVRSLELGCSQRAIEDEEVPFLLQALSLAAAAVGLPGGGGAAAPGGGAAAWYRRALLPCDAHAFAPAARGSFAAPVEYLFDLEADPFERLDLIGSGAVARDATLAAVADALRARLAAFNASRAPHAAPRATACAALGAREGDARAASCGARGGDDALEPYERTWLHAGRGAVVPWLQCSDACAGDAAESAACAGRCACT